MRPEADSEFIGDIYEIVIRSETNDGRFEHFSRDIVSFLEGGAPIFSTSKSWDLGRDAVGFGRATGIYVCTSLRDDPDVKALADIERLEQTTTKITRVYFCSSQKLSEHARDKVVAALNIEVDHKYPIVCLGSIQLAEAARQEKKAIERSYSGEIKNCLAAIEVGPNEEAETNGLRLALMTSGAEDSHIIRNSIYEAALLDSLSMGSRTAVVAAKSLAETLKLHRSLPANVVLPYLSNLTSKGFASENNGVYSITINGKVRKQDNERAAAERLMVGRNQIKEALEVAMGATIGPDEFSRIWAVFEERLSYFLYMRGGSIVDEVSALLDADSAAPLEQRISLSFIDELAAAVSKTSSHPQHQLEICQAVKDLFADRTGPASQWLVSVCAAFVAACALGLEQSSADAIGRLLARTTIVLDTDVVLSLLGEGEPEHMAALTIVNTWVRNRGAVVVAEPVLEEVAYHASIADLDFSQVSHLLPGTPEDRLHAVENAFVRSFAELLSQNKIKHSHWTTYIRHFRGDSAYDYSVVQGHLMADFSISKLPPRTLDQAALFETVRLYILKLVEERNIHGVTKEARDKASRDAELYVAFVRHMQTRRQFDPGAACLLISSGRRLSAVEAQFKQSGERQMVISIASALFLVSLLPQLSLGLSSMKAFLFDEKRTGFSSGLERTLIRMVKSSKEVSLPWAQRGVLMQQMRERMVKSASLQGLSKSESSLDNLEREALKPDHREGTIQMLRDSLDALALDTRLEKQVRDLKGEVAKLQEKLERANRPKKKN